MKITYTEHLVARLKLRKIPKSLARKVYVNREIELFDNLKNHHICLSRGKLFGKIRLLVVAYDKLEDRVELVTLYPSNEAEIENKIKSGRWTYEKS